MASSLDLQEQEQLDALKAAWKRYGNLVTWVLIIVLAAYAGWNLWQRHERSQAADAGAMYDELDRAAQAGDVDKVLQRFGDLKARFPRTASAQQGALLAARVLYDRKKIDEAQSALAWVADGSGDEEYKALARLRLAGLLIERKQYADAYRTLDAVQDESFAALVADRRGDALLAEGKRDDARAAYQKAWDAMPETLEYRGLVETKLNALGVAPKAKAATPAASGASQ